ncbi:YhgE/Pip family protein [Microbacterium sp. LRZ72]|uniref:YhgE/Pip family protein n=1 Tax=Microbacterium sp. LRZ72 TaxID=2942481 RepID=UPI0029A18565|nr:YhgE/Pip family protein [Microbacterium sp. LRZ72]MDX2376020.1 YhgE/Pip family protein [Microbacterium sp. LRZ72]
MTLPVERARSRRPVTWLTVLGVLLLPVILGGILVASLYDPTDRLEAMTAAIVNEDEPVTIDGQTTPLGRQLSAGLVEGTGEDDTNLTWVLSNADDAATGLADGEYQAVVTIPADFSASATSSGRSLQSTGQAAGEVTPERAVIEVTTPPDSLIVDDAITAQVTQTAATVLGEQLSTVTLENVFLGFTTLGDQLGEAAAGASDLADGTADAAEGAAELPGGIAQLGDGASSLSSGAGQLADGLSTLANETRGAADGAQELADGAAAGATQIEQQGLVPAQLLDLAAGAQTTATDAATLAGSTAQELGGLAADCIAAGATPEFCTQLGAAAQDSGAAAQAMAGAAEQSAYTAGGLDQLAGALPGEIATQFREIAGGAGQLAGGIDQLAAGTDQSAAGARELQTGASQLATGLDELETGTAQLADGLDELAGGTSSLAAGLDEAASSLPSYTEGEAENLAEVVSDPVEAAGVGSALFGASAIPLLTTLVLWVGGLATFIVLGTGSRRALPSSRPSIRLMAGSFVPAAIIGAAQGLLVAGVVQIAASYDWADWTAFAGLCVLAGVVFAAVNQALVAVFGGAGRWIAALVGVLVVATGVVSTVPGPVSGLASLMPTAPAYHAMVAALSGADGVGASVAGLLAWGVITVVATTLALARRRTTTSRAVLAPSA